VIRDIYVIRRNAVKIPEDWVVCPACDRHYSFIRCRVTSGGKNRCLRCHIEYKNALKQENQTREEGGYKTQPRENGGAGSEHIHPGSSQVG